MKKVVGPILMLVVFATMMVGCASPGGYVIGPVSALTSRGNERAMVKRAALQSKALNQQQKRDVISASAGTHSAEEISVMVGVDLLALRGQSLTAAEIGKQALGALGDAVIYGACAYGLNEAGAFDWSSSSSDSSEENVTVNVTGSQDTTVVIDGDTAQTGVTN